MDRANVDDLMMAFLVVMAKAGALLPEEEQADSCTNANNNGFRVGQDAPGRIGH